MLIFKRTLLVLVASLFTTLLFTTAWDYGIMKTIGTDKPIKKTLDDSGVYQDIVSALLNQSKTSTSSSGDLSLADPLIQKAANASLTPAVLKTNTEKILDSVYVWLGSDGKTVPDFKVDLSGPKVAFASNVATEIQAKLAALPACSSSVSAASFDSLSATCVPKGISASAEATKAKNNLLTGKGFLENPVITANNLKSNSADTTSVFATAKIQKIPSYFAWLKKAPFILMGLTLLTGLAIVFLSSTRAAGLRKIGFTLTFVGLLMLAFAYGANYLVSKKALNSISINNNAVLTQNIKTIAKDLTQEIDKTYWIFGGSYLTLGVLSIAYPMIRPKFGGKTKSSKPQASSAETSDTKPAIHEPTTTAPKAEEVPKKRTINVQ